MKILMILTSHAKLGNTGKETGLWLEEFAAPYYIFRDAGASITLASPLGGQPPVDPASDASDAQTDATRRFHQDAAAQAAMAATARLADIDESDYDAVFFPGGHGPLWDLAENGYVTSLIRDFYGNGKPVAAVCHGPAVFRHAKTRDGRGLVQGKDVTGFSNTEEAAAGLTDVVPFLVEDMLKEHGAHYTKEPDWHAHVVIHDNLITGQNPASSEAAAQALLAQLD